MPFLQGRQEEDEHAGHGIEEQRGAAGQWDARAVRDGDAREQEVDGVASVVKELAQWALCARAPCLLPINGVQVEVGGQSHCRATR